MKNEAAGAVFVGEIRARKRNSAIFVQVYGDFL